MVAYSFEDRHHAAILSGDKPFTMRRTGKKRHARVGEAMTGRAGRTGPTFVRMQCVFRARVVITPTRLLRVLDVQQTGEAGEALARLFAAAEQGAAQADDHAHKLALQDGFSCWRNLWEWHFDQEPESDDAMGAITREVIGWAQVEAV